MRADRLLSILLHLQLRKRMTARELAQRLEVSERTIHRDMEALGIAGIPVMADRGVGGGWSLLEGYETNLTGLKETEIQALFLAKPARLLADLGLDQAADAALDKLLAALPALHREDAEHARQRIYIDTAGWQRSEENVAFLPVLQEAIWQERKVQSKYELSTGPLVAPLLDPLGLVAKGSTWYLVAVFQGANCVYRVSRIYDAYITEFPCIRPKNFDLAAFWAESSANFIANLPKYPVKVRVLSTLLPRLRHGCRFARVQQVERPDARGWQEVDMMFETEEEACEAMLSFGAQIEVLEPTALREQVYATARATVNHYTNNSAPALVDAHVDTP